MTVLGAAGVPSLTFGVTLYLLLPDAHTRPSPGEREPVVGGARGCRRPGEQMRIGSYVRPMSPIVVQPLVPL